jgi:hypothetical protein
MKPGDLRQFKTKSYAPAEPNIGGETFMVLAVEPRRDGQYVSLLLKGKVVEDWDLPWVAQNSEAVNEAG